MTLAIIDQQTREYAAARKILSERMQTLEDEMQAVKRRRLAGIKTALSKVVETHDRLHQSISDHPDLFEKPRTLVIEEVKVGFRKQKGKLEFNDNETVCRRIHQHLPDQADLLIKTTERPVKSALEQLSGAELKRLGVTLTDDVDTVVIKPTDSRLDTLVNALIQDAIDDEPQVAAA